jgi:hypothetical protein
MSTASLGGFERVVSAIPETPDALAPLLSPNFCVARMAPGFFLLLTGADPPSDDLWERYLDWGHNDLTAFSKNGRVLNLTLGGTPTPHQREVAAARTKLRLGEQGTRKVSLAIVIRAGAIQRMIIATMHLVWPEMRGFSPEDWPRVVSHLRLSATEERAAQMVLSALRDERERRRFAPHKVLDDLITAMMRNRAAKLSASG